ncbi:MAG: putative cobaltochelatase [Chloroflexi bacterium]|nr:putative cobaltochelatase [Chloroflexota bacterium]MYD49333.1 putative cobaltochelatase [Chloroflexota bacterium]
MTQPAAGREPRFPFTAIVGQTPMKRALLLNAINPRIGGVLVRGKKGTAKSTAVRSLAALLPQVPVVPGCLYSCQPGAPQEVCQRCHHAGPAGSPSARQVRIVDLPVGATEDRLVGSLDIEQAIKSGEKNFEPGLIAAAHRGILYIDEVNLLNDHLVDVLLDAAAMGRNYVEREGISISHDAEFMLVGTMNPEEGDLRPQLLDRFGLAVEVDGVFEPAERREVVRRRMAFESQPFAFMDAWADAEQEERKRLLDSQRRLADVVVPDDILELITDICAEYQVDGLRGDIVMYKTASTIAAYEGRTVVDVDDVREAALMALLHRQRRQPFQQPHLVTEQLDQMLEEFQNQPRNREPADADNSLNDDPGDADSDRDPEPPEPETDDPVADAGLGDEWFEIGDPYAVQNLQVQPPDRRARRASGRRATTVSGTSAGHYVAARVPNGPAADLALDATLRAAAPHQQTRRINSGPGPDTQAAALLIEPWDVREKVRETHTGSLILFVVDASGSMGAQRRMVAVKGAVMSLLLDAYQRRDRVGLIAFRGTGAELLLPPTGSVEMAQWCLQEMPTGGRTPLARALYLAMETLETERLKDRDVLPLLVLLSDGRANVTLAGEQSMQIASSDGEVQDLARMIAEAKIPAVVVDTEQDFIKLQLSQPIADAMSARYIKLDDLAAESLADAVRRELPGEVTASAVLP